MMYNRELESHYIADILGILHIKVYAGLIKKKLAMKGVPVRWPPTSDTKHEHFSFRPQPIQRVGCPSLLLGMKVGYIASHLKEKAYRAFKSPYSSFSEQGQGHHFSEDGRGGFI